MSKITFLEAIRQLIQSKDHEQYQFHRGILTSGIDTDISSGEFHMAADFINQVCNELTGDQTLEQSLQYKGMSQKTETISMLVDLISKIDLKGNMGAVRFVHECRHLLCLKDQIPAAFTPFDSAMSAFLAGVDSLMNATSTVSIKFRKQELIEAIELLNPTEYSGAARLLNKRTAEFINLVNDPTSSFSELDEAVSSGIVTELTLLEMSLVAEPYQVMLPEMPDTASDQIELVQVTDYSETPAPVARNMFSDIFNALKTLKPDSREYNAKIAFFNRYLANMDICEIRDMYKSAAELVCKGSLEDTILVDSLFHNVG